MSDVKGIDIIDHLSKMFVCDPHFENRNKKFQIDAYVAQMIYDARIDAGLTQEQLAELIDVEPDVIAQLEEVDFEGETFPMVQKIAAALNMQIGLVPIKR